MPQIADELNFKVELASPPQRIVSLVPSWTETIFAFGLGERLAGATRYCVAPAEAAAVPKFGGTKNPDLKGIIELRPDLVIANAEENRREDIEALRAAGHAVFVPYPRKISAAVEPIIR